MRFEKEPVILLSLGAGPAQASGSTLYTLLCPE
jgi:hypothetical protein